MDPNIKPYRLYIITTKVGNKSQDSSNSSNTTRITWLHDGRHLWRIEWLILMRQQSLRLRWPLECSRRQGCGWRVLVWGCLRGAGGVESGLAGCLEKLFRVFGALKQPPPEKSIPEYLNSNPKTTNTKTQNLQPYTLNPYVQGLRRVSGPRV